MELPNQGKMRTQGKKETYKYLGIMEAGAIKQVEMKEKIKKEYLKRNRKLHERKPRDHSWHWPKKKLRKKKKKKRKQMTMHKALHPRNIVDRLYVSRKEEGKGLASNEDRVDVSLQKLEDYKDKRGEGLITATRYNIDYTKSHRTIIIHHSSSCHTASTNHLFTPSYRLSLLVGLQGYILHRHNPVIYRF